MTEFDIRVQYNEDSVVVFELEDDSRYEIIRWTTKELETTEGLLDTVETTKEMAKESPRGLIEKFFGTVANWNEVKDQRKF